MASLFKQDGLYYGQFFSKHRTPQRKRVPLKTSKKAEARQLLAVLESRFRAGSYDPWKCCDWTLECDREGEEGSVEDADATPSEVTVLTLREAVDAYLASCAHLRPYTRKTYREIMEPFARHAGETSLIGDLEPAHVRRWLDSTKAGDVTRRKYVNHLGYLFRFLVGQGAMKSDLSKAVKLRKVPEQTPKSLTPEMVESFVSTANQWVGYDYGWLADMVEANVEVGLRRGELLALHADHVDLDRGILRVVNGDGFTTKSGKERAVPLSSTARTILRRRKETRTGLVFESPLGPISPDGLSHAFRKVRERADLPSWVNLHSTRHTALTRLAERGVPVEVIRQFAGHSSVAVTERYTRMRPDAIYDHVLRAFG